MTRADALERWRRIAAGDLRREQYDEIDLHAWIEEVAKAVIEADEQPSSGQRPNDLTEAIGLQGKKEPYPDLRRFLEVWIEFDDLDPLDHGDSSPRLTAIGRQFLPAGLDDDAVLKRVSGVLERIRKAK
ncbi:MAG: hypothetical protein ACO1OR_08315 [Hydrogenophaga sp.]